MFGLSKLRIQTPARSVDVSSTSSDVRSIRRILHCDMDCFYAAVHIRDDPELRGKPVVVGGSPSGRGVVAAASYEARKYGIHSAMSAAKAVRRCPDAIFIRPDFPRYREASETIFGIFRDFTPIVQPASLDEAYLDVTDHLGSFGTATAVAKEIRRRVRDETGLTVSVGVGPNRLVAKIASDFDKPDGLTVVHPVRVQGFLDPLPVRKIHGVGPATERALNAIGITTIAELRAVDSTALGRRFGRQGQWLHNASHGIDERPVRTGRARRSLGHERTYSEDIRTLEEMDECLTDLAGRVASGLERREISARTVTVKVRYPDFTTLTRSRTLERPTASRDQIETVAKQLLRRTDAGTRHVRLLGVTASGLIDPDDGPPAQLRLI